jgi:hypothetical protein
MDDIIEFDKENPVEGDFSTARLIIIHGLLHEAAHSLALHMPKEWENELLGIIEDSYKGRVEFKNWVKALRGTRNFRKEQDIDKPVQYTQDVLIKSFLTEMFCDLFAVYLLEQSSSTEEHIFKSVFGEEMTDELRAFFQKYLELLQHLDKSYRLMVFSDEHILNSGMHSARSYTSAFTIPLK